MNWRMQDRWDFFLETLHTKHASTEDTHNEILMVYGDAIVRDVCCLTLANYFATIVEGKLEHLRNMATRIRECGTEKITTRKQSVSRK